MKKVIRLLFYCIVTPIYLFILLLVLPLAFIFWADKYAFNEQMDGAMIIVSGLVLELAYLIGIAYLLSSLAH